MMGLTAIVKIVVVSERVVVVCVRAISEQRSQSDALRLTASSQLCRMGGGLALKESEAERAGEGFRAPYHARNSQFGSYRPPYSIIDINPLLLHGTYSTDIFEN